MDRNKKKFLLIGIGTVVILASLGLGGFLLYEMLVPDVTDPGIETEVVDDDGWIGIDACIALDRGGVPHISHYDQGNRDLKYAVKADSEWQNETVDSEGDVGEESGIAISEDGVPHISYNDSTNGDLKYARNVDGSWDIQIVDEVPGGYHTVSTSLALDSNDYPHIAYNVESDLADDEEDPDLVKGVEDEEDDGIYDGDEEDDGDDEEDGVRGVKYAWWDGASWNIDEEIIAPDGTDVYLALDASDDPHLSFKSGEADGDSQKIFYAAKIDGAWGTVNVDSEAVAGGDTGIALNSKGYPHIAYNDYGNIAKKHAYWDGSAWHTSVVAEDTGNCEGIKIDINWDDKPFVVYNVCDEEGGKDDKEGLRLAGWSGSSWDVRRVDRMGNPSIVIDPSNNIHLAYGHTAQDKGDVFKEIRDETGEEEIEILKYAFID